jgi:hypothetical protein
MLYLGLASPTFTAGNLASLLNNNAVNVIWAVGLLVVLIARHRHFFAVSASVARTSPRWRTRSAAAIGFSASCSRESSE